MSLSSGELRIGDSRATYELRMPLYEIIHLDEPEAALLTNFRLRQDGKEIHRSSGRCTAETGEGVYRCRSDYELTEPPDRLEVECTFASVTVPNHVHVLQVIHGDLRQQAVFDFSFTRSTIRFTPPTTAEIILSQMSAGGVRVIAGPFQVLFLLALVLAGRSRRELLFLAGAFILAEAVSAVVVAAQGWQPAARFVEAAAALTVAYLAVEILLLPEAGYRWLIAGAMGVFHGLYFGSFLQQSGMNSALVLAGVVFAEALLLLLFAGVLAKLKAGAAKLRPVQAGAAVLFVVGIVWFVLRVRS